MKIEIQNYITCNYYQLLAIAKKYTKNDDWASELLHESIIQIYDQKEFKGNLDDKSLKYYFIRVIMGNWCFKTSPFYRKHKLRDMVEIDINEALNIISETTEIDQHEILESIETEWTELPFFDKVIFEKYMVLGSLKKVSVDTGIPLTSIKRYVDNTKKTIKENTFKKLKQ